MSQQAERSATRRTRAPWPARTFAVAVAGMAAVVAAAPGAATAQSASSAGVVVHEGALAGGAASKQSESTVQAKVSDSPSGAEKAGERPVAPRQVPKVDARLAKLPASGRVRVVITFAEDQKIPRMPSPTLTQSRGSSANVAAQARANTLVQDLKARRAARYDRIQGDLKRLDADVVDQFWLINGVTADVPVTAVDAIAKRPDVQRIELDDTGARPPADSDPDNDEADARSVLRSDPYFALNQTSGWIGLLDTGVRATHTLLSNPSHISIREDLTNTTSPNPNDDCWNHGTSTAAIITGNGNLGDAFRGVSGITLDSFKVYPSGCGGLSETAAVNGFQRAVNVLDRVIVAEMQAGGTETSPISVAADAAFDAGAVVVSANGNNGPNASTVNVPAVAQKVLGIGAIDVKSLATQSYESRGPAGDGRFKPDLQAPTNAETASNASDTATRAFGGTSGATPNAAGAAALVRNFLRGGTGNVDPGDVYAYMLTSGTQAYPFNNDVGAGRIKLPVNGNFWHGSTTIANAQTMDIPISVPATGNQLNAAIWWPEAPASHNDVDLSLVDPNGVVRASSPSAAGVFERVSVNGPLTAGTWQLRLRGFWVPSGPQRVYFAAAHTTP